MDKQTDNAIVSGERRVKTSENTRQLPDGTATAPAVVYLDSQDFSNFCPSSSASSRVASVREELLDLKDRGLARFVFSDIHVFEAMPTDPIYARGGLERMRTIAHWCDANYLPSSISLMEFELKKMLGMSVEAPTDWFPDFDFPPPSREKIKESVREIASPYMNRAMRRRLEKQISSGRTRMSQRDAAESAEEFAAQFPFLGGDTSSMQRYFSGDGPWSSVKNSVEEGLRDIAGFATWLVDNWEHGQKFANILRETSKPFLSSLEKVRTDTAAGVQRALLTMDRRDVANALARGSEDARMHLFEIMPGSFAAKILNISDVSSEVRFSIEKTPSIMTMWHFIFELMKRSATLASPRAPSPSDFADANHVLFARHVDIYRTDQFAAEALARLKMTPTTTIVADLGRLPGAIRSVAEGRGR